LRSRAQFVHADTTTGPLEGLGAIPNESDSFVALMAALASMHRLLSIEILPGTEVKVLRIFSSFLYAQVFFLYLLDWNFVTLLLRLVQMVCMPVFVL
jgi:hypothetical protein